MATWIKTNIIDVERTKVTAPGGDVGGLKTAGPSGVGGHKDSIGIVLSVDKDDATRQAKRDQEAATKRAQNTLPAWHLKSTVSGDSTSLGIKEKAGVEEAAVTLHSSNNTIIEGVDHPVDRSGAKESNCEYIWSTNYGHLPSPNS